jgi:hypothetical protein
VVLVLLAQVQGVWLPDQTVVLDSSSQHGQLQRVRVTLAITQAEEEVQETQPLALVVPVVAVMACLMAERLTPVPLILVAVAVVTNPLRLLVQQGLAVQGL